MSAFSEVFSREYKKLNPEQKRAVDAIEGPVMVIAGPGTGKTQTLTLRIANILRNTDTAPENILALTFTESGAYSMRRRLVDIIGSAAYKVTITTFHGFCNDIIGRFPDEFPRIIGATNATEIDQIRIVERILEEGKFTLLRPYGDPFFHVRNILSAIQHMKREAIAPETFENIVAEEEKAFSRIPDLYNEQGARTGKMKTKYQTQEKQIAKNKELVRVYTAYQKELAAARLYDYEDMIMEVVAKMEADEDFRLVLQEEFQYILADEHQDTNNAQNRILELLASFFDEPNLFVVGDEKQAIFRFQGASLDNFLYFKKKFPSVTLITLKANYRSSQSILDGAYSLMKERAGMDPSLDERLVSADGGRGEQIALRVFSRPEYEYLFLVDEIQSLIDGGIPPEEIAILYRDNRDVHEVVRYLEKTDVPFTVESDKDLLSDPDVAKLLLILRAITNLGDDHVLARMLYIDFLDIDSLDIYKTVTYSRKQKKGLYAIIRSHAALRSAGAEDPDALADLYKKLASWSKAARNKGLLDTFEIVVRESGLLDSVLTEPGSIDRMAKIDSFFAEAKKVVERHKDYTLADFIVHLDVLKNYRVLVKSGRSSVIRGVRLMTAHKAKGLEFDYVYVIGAYNKHWGGRTNRSGFRITDERITLAFQGGDEDERRLFYVALTRARKRAAISYAQENIEGSPQLPSQFLEEIDKKLIAAEDMAERERRLSMHRHRQFAPRRGFGPSATDRDYLRTLFLEQGFSVTALNNYLSCPWRYFYNSLVRIPKPYTKQQIYGTAVHDVLREYFDAYRGGEDRGKEFMLTRFEHILYKQPLPRADYEELLLKGQQMLAGYYNAYRKTWPHDIANELSIGGVSLEVDDADGTSARIPLKGKLDKVEGLDRGAVNVVDYKTSKPKSRNAIEGKTKTGNADYKRQLVFYRLLLDLDKRHEMETGEIDFVESDARGRYHKERFAISERDVCELEKTIRAAAKEILSLGFWDRICADTQCDYCAIRQMMAE